MSEIERIRDQLGRSFAGEAWHGPSVLEVLEGVSAHQAAQRPIGAAHTVWEVVLHLTGTYRVVLRRLCGDASPMTPEEDWPAVGETTGSAWAATLQELRKAHEELMRALTDSRESALGQPMVDGSPSLYGALHGMAQHNTYHAGQIALLRKAFA